MQGEWEEEEEEREPWEQMEGEPDLWYARFQVFLELGVMRSLTAAARAAGERKRGKPGTRNGQWSYAFYRWSWRERAHAWDAHQRELLAFSERSLRLGLRQRRVARMEDYLDTVAEVLNNAHMTEADEKQARDWLPQMRVFLRDLLVAERQEFEKGDYEQDDANVEPPITADDLIAAQRELDARARAAAERGDPKAQGSWQPWGTRRWGESVAQLHAAGGPPQQGSSQTRSQTISHKDREEERQALPPTCGERVRGRYPAGRTLVVCSGSGGACALDLPSLRKVRAATGLEYMRVLEATRQKLATTLRRERHLGRPIELLHLALPLGPHGVTFVDGVADEDWLRRHLADVRVLMLEGCEPGSGAGDKAEEPPEWTRAVPFVVMVEGWTDHEDAGRLAQQFWHNVGLGMEPKEALTQARADAEIVT